MGSLSGMQYVTKIIKSFENIYNESTHKDVKRPTENWGLLPAISGTKTKT